MEQVELMHFLIICRVIDNLGDAGFCTRLALQLCCLGHSVELVCDKPETIRRLEDVDKLTGISLLDMDEYERNVLCSTSHQDHSTVILEPFGTSSEQTSSRKLNDKIKGKYPSRPWLVIDYLSAEDWTKSFHLSNSTCPRTGHVSTYFYPGFEVGTGGLIHADLPTTEWPPTPLASEKIGFREIFAFSYTFAPVKALEQCMTPNQTLTIAGDETTPEGATGKRIGFCRLTEFDQLLHSFDFVFVRGEDSFVRAQLAGRPFVWNIYPTQDGAHAEKLIAFFNVYKQGLSQETAGALLSLWWIWNNLDKGEINPPSELENAPSNLAEAWAAVQAASSELTAHALQWKSRLLNGPELVREILTWASSQSPTCHK